MVIDIALMVLMVLAALLTVMSARLLRAAIGLAVTSALLTALMFRLGSPLAAVFELSVCAGLIPAIFITTIGLTQRLTPEALLERRKEKLRRFWFLPVAVIFLGIALSQAQIPPELVALGPSSAKSVGEVLWISRHIDLFGQIIILLGGVFAVVALVVEPNHE